MELVKSSPPVPHKHCWISDYESHMAFKRANAMSEAIGRNTFETPVNVTVAEYVHSLLLSQRNRLNYSGLYPEKKYRKSLVNLIIHIGEREKLHQATVFKAVYLLDRFMAHHSIKSTQLEMVAVTCVIISGKVEEIPDRTPNLKKLRRYISLSSSRLFVDIERYILNFFDFFVMIPTEVEFFDVLSLYVVDEIRQDQVWENMEAETHNTTIHERICDMHIKRFSPQTLKQLRDELEVDLDYFEDIPGSRHVAENIIMFGKAALRDLLMEEPPKNPTWSPSLIAAAVVLYGRIRNGLLTWTETLHSISSHSVHETWKCLCSFVLPTLHSAHPNKYKFDLTGVYQHSSSNFCNASCVLYNFNIEVESQQNNDVNNNEQALTKSLVPYQQ